MDTEENRFFEQPILNSPYEYPRQHWELDANGQPTQRIIDSRRKAEFITAIPKPRKQKNQKDQQDSTLFDALLRGPMARPAESQYLECNAGNCPPPSALASPPLRRDQAVLLARSRQSRRSSGSLK